MEIYRYLSFASVLHFENSLSNVKIKSKKNFISPNLPSDCTVDCFFRETRIKEVFIVAKS